MHKLYKNGRVQSEKLNTLKQHLLIKKKQRCNAFRCIIFVKQRISAYVLAQHLNSDKRVKDHGIRADL